MENEKGYIVIEIQKLSSDTESSCITTSFNDLNQAMNKYHQILAAAAISVVYKHSAVLLSDDGTWMKSESFEH